MVRKILDILALAWNADGYPGWRRLYHPIWLYQLFRDQWPEHEYQQVEMDDTDLGSIMESGDAGQV